MTVLLLGPTPPQDVKAFNKDTGFEISWKKPCHPISKMVKQFNIQILESQTTDEAFVSGDVYVFMYPNCKPMANYSFKLSTLTTNELESNATEMIEIRTRGRNAIDMNAIIVIVIVRGEIIVCNMYYALL